ncbi:hypothetical protein [Pedobacter sp. AJM]|uniref:hypothetical protein n=1 Tax=Pedobacter sp. AJM TaxID=2003629 RepID=UPI000B4BC3B7|nr:hypothetical protein [Pedobacter sp. AJM]OWK70687.1 hypothetical protein CBW18_06175 [Pedobacter sp. AJM]
MERSSLLIFIFLCFFNTAFGQDDPIQAATYHFQVKESLFTGNGSDTLKKYIQQAQFFLIGEEHNMKALQDFTTAIIPFLKSSGYQNLALEIGPFSAEKIRAMYQNKQTITDFNTRYDSDVKGSPFGFFEGKEEEQFSNQAFRNGFRLWGLDFENYNAALFILDELYSLSKKSSELDRSYQAARHIVIAEYAKDRKDQTYNLPGNLLHAATVQAFFKRVATTPQARYIISQQLRSWYIYDAQSRKNWYARVKNMRDNFMLHYNRALETNKNPKVFVKMGAVHLARGTSSSGFEEVGQLIDELAKKNKKKVFSVISFARYRIDAQGKLVDLLEEADAELLKYTTAASWSLIDLNRLRNDAKQGKLKLSEAMRSYMEHYDMMLIPPATPSMTPNVHR